MRGAAKTPAKDPNDSGAAIDALASARNVRAVRLCIQPEVRAWGIGGMILEHYSYGPGPAGCIEPHAHETHQICASLGTPGEYHYRGSRHPVPPRSISVVHPGERHSVRDVAPRRRPARYWVLYVPREAWEQVGETASRGAGHIPFFGDPVIMQRETFHAVAGRWEAAARARSRLEGEEHLVASLAVVRRHATVHPPPARRAREEDPRLARVRDYLETAPSEATSLADLALLAGLSPWELCRGFARRFGLPPHAYLLQVRVREDQSHFHRAFRRAAGTTPGRYAGDRKIVQELRAQAR